MGEMQKTLKKRRKQIEKNIENEKKERQRIQEKSNNNKHFWFTFYIKNIYFARKHILKKPSSYHHILFKVFMRCRVFVTQ